MVMLGVPVTRVTTTETLTTRFRRSAPEARMVWSPLMRGTFDATKLPVVSLKRVTWTGADWLALPTFVSVSVAGSRFVYVPLTVIVAAPVVVAEGGALILMVG